MNRNDDSRLKEFRQLKHEIRGSTEYLVVGIDVAKERHHAFFGTATGKTLMRKLVFDNTREGFEKLTFQADTLRPGMDSRRWSSALNPPEITTSL